MVITFLIWRPFDTVPHVVGTPSRKIIFVTTSKLHFASVMNGNVKISVFDLKEVAWVDSCRSKGFPLSGRVTLLLVCVYAAERT